MNKGKLCPLGAASLEQIYNPRRLKYPMRRVGARGEGRWKRVSWDEAYDEMVNKIRQAPEKDGAESILFYTTALIDTPSSARRVEGARTF